MPYANKESADQLDQRNCYIHINDSLINVTNSLHPGFQDLTNVPCLADWVMPYLVANIEDKLFRDMAHFLLPHFETVQNA